MDFKPEAVLRLIDRMRINNETGAACGRIHPKGSSKFRTRTSIQPNSKSYHKILLRMNEQFFKVHIQKLGYNLYYWAVIKSRKKLQMA